MINFKDFAQHLSVTNKGFCMEAPSMVKTREMVDNLVHILFPLKDECKLDEDDIQIELSLETFLDDLEMEKAQKAAAKTQAQRTAAFGLELEARVVDPQLLERVAQRAGVFLAVDADARLPSDYFSRLPRQRVAAVSWPYCHGPGDTPAETDACERYELHLHHYVLGLAWAGSPYAFHTLGSCISVHVEHYAQVGGVPRRNGAEDFYLLNKLAKTGAVRQAVEDEHQRRRQSVRFRARVDPGDSLHVAQLEFDHLRHGGAGQP